MRYARRSKSGTGSDRYDVADPYDVVEEAKRMREMTDMSAYQVRSSLLRHEHVWILVILTNHCYGLQHTDLQLPTPKKCCLPKWRTRRADPNN